MCTLPSSEAYDVLRKPMSQSGQHAYQPAICWLDDKCLLLPGRNAALLNGKHQRRGSRWVLGILGSGSMALLSASSRLLTTDPVARIAGMNALVRSFRGLHEFRTTRPGALIDSTGWQKAVAAVTGTVGSLFVSMRSLSIFTNLCKRIWGFLGAPRQPIKN